MKSYSKSLTESNNRFWGFGQVRALLVSLCLEEELGVAGADAEDGVVAVHGTESVGLGSIWHSQAECQDVVGHIATVHEQVRVGFHLLAHREHNPVRHNRGAGHNAAGQCQGRGFHLRRHIAVEHTPHGGGGSLEVVDDLTVEGEHQVAREIVGAEVLHERSTSGRVGVGVVGHPADDGLELTGLETHQVDVKCTSISSTSGQRHVELLGVESLTRQAVHLGTVAGDLHEVTTIHGHDLLELEVGGFQAGSGTGHSTERNAGGEDAGEGL